MYHINLHISYTTEVQDVYSTAEFVCDVVVLAGIRFTIVSRRVLLWWIIIAVNIIYVFITFCRPFEFWWYASMHGVIDKFSTGHSYPQCWRLKYRTVRGICNINNDMLTSRIRMGQLLWKKKKNHKIRRIYYCYGVLSTFRFLCPER